MNTATVLERPEMLAIPNKKLPIVGAAMPIEALELHQHWILEQHRDLEIQDGFRSDVLDGDWKPLVAKAKSLLEGYTGRMGIHGPFDGLLIASWDAPVREFVRNRYLKALEFAEGLGASHMVMHSPFLYFGHPMVAHTKANGLNDQIGWAHETLNAVVARASEIGCQIVIENIRDTNPLPLLELVKSFNSEFVRMSLDTGHANLMHEIGAPTADQWVHDAGAYLGHVHLQDNDAQLDRHWHPGRGSINWYAVFKAIEKLEHQPRLILEVRDADVMPAFDWLVNQGFVR
jgi:sugar phosphate isomerase/epimerase